MADTISRQAAIDAILAIKDYGNSDRANALGLAECAVTTLPSAQPEQRWIPCSERNPDKDGIYLITITPKYLNGTAEVRQVYWSGRWAGYLKKEVLAWMPLPLPEPYKGEP